MTVTPRVVASGLAFPESPLVLDDGSVLVSEIAAGRITRVGVGETQTYAVPGGGPNGIAWSGADLLVCQNGGSTWGYGPWPYDLPHAASLFRPIGPADAWMAPQVQKISPDGAVTTLATTFAALDGTHRPLVRPSDICGDGAGGFYMTDGGTTRGRMRELSGLLHGTPEGDIREIVYPLEMPNGLAMSPDRSRLYVAETRTRRIWEFEVVGPGKLAGGRGLATVGSGGPLNIGGADGLCVDSNGCIIVATLGTGGITVFDRHGSLIYALPMADPLTTSVALDGERDRLIVTLASTGTLVAIDSWSTVL